MAKKNFKSDIEGADKLFSANDKAENKEDVTEDNAINNTLTNTLINTKNSILDNILTNIKEEPKGKNYTFYLSNEVATAVMATAKKSKISNSKLVDNILKKILLED